MLRITKVWYIYSIRWDVVALVLDAMCIVSESHHYYPNAPATSMSVRNGNIFCVFEWHSC